MTKLFHINIHVNKKNINAFFDSILKENNFGAELVNELGLEVHDCPIRYPLVWVNKDAKIKVSK